MWNSQSIYVVVFLALVATVASTSTFFTDVSSMLHHNHNNLRNENSSRGTPAETSEMKQDDLSLLSRIPELSTMNTDIETILNDLQKKYHDQPLFLQAVQEMMLSIGDLLENDPLHRRAFALMTEPERTISFRVTWMDDHGHLQLNRGWRIEFNR